MDVEMEDAAAAVDAGESHPLMEAVMEASPGA